MEFQNTEVQDVNISLPYVTVIQFFQSLSEQIYRVSPFLHEIKTFTIILILHGKFSPILFVAVVCCFRRPIGGFCMCVYDIVLCGFFMD